MDTQFPGIDEISGEVMTKINRRTFTRAAIGGAALATLPMAAHADPSSDWLVGLGIHDITGAVAETGSFGYAANQTMTGLHQRLYAHAYVFAHPTAPAQRTVFVSVDLGAMFQSITLAVAAQLARRFGTLYRLDNIMLSATHTHVGNSGHSHDRLYQIAGNDAVGYGYDEHNFTACVDGIVEAIAKADDTLAPATIRLQTGELSGATRNRSLPAYQANPDADQYATSVNETMVQLRIDAPNGKPRGLINWFAIHPTSFSLKSTLISGDNKGYAQYFLETAMGAHPSEGSFVASFAQSDEGDTVSSHGNAFSAEGYGGGPDEFANCEVDGKRQLDKAVELFRPTGCGWTGHWTCAAAGWTSPTTPSTPAGPAARRRNSAWRRAAHSTWPAACPARDSTSPEPWCGWPSAPWPRWAATTPARAPRPSCCPPASGAGHPPRCPSRSCVWAAWPSSPCPARPPP